MKTVKDLPDYQQKQRLLYRDGVATSEIEAAAEKCEKAGSYNDAMELWHKIEKPERITAIADIAKEEGDFFLFRKAHLLNGTEVSADTWQELAKRALDLGKISFAKEAFTLAGDEARANECELKMNSSNEDNSHGKEQENEQEQGHDAA